MQKVQLKCESFIEGDVSYILVLLERIINGFMALYRKLFSLITILYKLMAVQILLSVYCVYWINVKLLAGK